MSSRVCHFHHLALTGSAGTDVRDVTEPVRNFLARIGGKNGGLALGVWRQSVVLDLGNRPRRHKVVIQVLGS